MENQKDNWYGAKRNRNSEEINKILTDEDITHLDLTDKEAVNNLNFEKLMYRHGISYEEIYD